MVVHDAVVFVYGTLTDPDRVEAVLGDERRPAGDGTIDASYEFVDSATLRGLHRVEGRYPTLAPGGEVEGQLLAVDRDGLDALDAYEGVHRDLYVRVGVPLERNETSPDATERADRAWTYVGDPERLGVAGRPWPGEEPFDGRVRRYVDRHEVTIRVGD